MTPLILCKKKIQSQIHKDIKRLIFNLDNSANIEWAFRINFSSFSSNLDTGLLEFKRKGIPNKYFQLFSTYHFTEESNYFFSF